MPTFTAIALERLIDPGAVYSTDKLVNSTKPVPFHKPPNPKPNSNSKLERRNSESNAERRVQPPRIKPALYATPETTPLSGSPSSFSPSPYVINHKRRGPCLLKSSSEGSFSSHQTNTDGEIKSNSRNHQENNLKEDASGSNKMANLVEIGFLDDVSGCENKRNLPDITNNAQIAGNEDMGNGFIWENNSPGNAARITEEGGVDDLHSPSGYRGYECSTDREDNDLIAQLGQGEFQDALDDFLSDGGSRSSFQNLEVQLRDMERSWRMEIDRREWVEESLTNLQLHWDKIRQALLVLGFYLPDYAVLEHEKLETDPAEFLQEQVLVTRSVSTAIGRGLARAEVEMDLEDRIEAKNSEIARLTDRLHFYEAMNNEMSQRNQEAKGMARQLRQRRKRRQRWFWGSIAVVASCGAAALIWSYVAAGEGSSGMNGLQPPNHCDQAK